MGIKQLNVEYFFRLLYDLIYGAHSSVSYASFEAFLTYLWTCVVIIGYGLSLIGLFFIVYTMVRIFELRKRESAFYGTLLVAPGSSQDINPRWKHIEMLAQGGSPSEWREAIVEADIMLDDMLTKQGYTGEGIGEKLRKIEASDFHTLNDAWEAHKVRNQIAHQGSSFDLSETLARRTIARYEAVFREFKAI